MNISKYAGPVTLVIAGIVATPVVVQAQLQTEDFDDTTFRDGVNTSADWDTLDPGGEFTGDDIGALKLPTAASAQINELTAPFTAATSADIDSQGLATRAVALADLDGDGDLDLAFGSNAGVAQFVDPTVQIFANDGTGTFTETSNAIPGGHVGSQINTRSVAVADFNADGYLDLVFAHFKADKQDQVHLNNPASPGTFNVTVNLTNITSNNEKGDSVAVGDIDNDNDIDIVIGGDSSLLKLYRNDGFGSFSDPVAVDPGLPSGRFPRTVLLGDLDHDDDLDLVAVLQDRNTLIYENDGSGNFSGPGTAGASLENELFSPDSASLADIDGDGDLDLLVGNDGINRVFKNGTTGTIGTSPNFFDSGADFGTDSFRTNTMLPVDVDRDGDLDIVTGELALGDSSTGEENLLYLNDGTGGFPASGTLITPVDRSKSIVAGDVNADGQPDLIIASDDNNQRVLNVGTDSGTPRDQLVATARSLELTPAPQSLRLTVTDNRVTEERNYRLWVTPDGGSNWLAAMPGVSIDPGAGADLRWRAEFRTNRAWTTQPEISVLTVRSNLPPSITGVTASTDEDALYSLDITASSGSSNDLFFVQLEGASVLPAWLTLSTDFQGTYTLSGTPTNDDVGLHTFDLEVVDAAGDTATDTFNITVDNTNDDPTVVAPIADQNATDDVAYSLDSSAAFDDVDAGDTLTYGASGLPASGNLAINSSTGEISGTPDDADVAGSPYTVTVTADDGNGGTPASDDFQLTIADANDDPVLDTPIADDVAVEGTPYSYDISGNFSDADAGDTLSYGASGLPASGNLTINAGTGVISGTPDNGDVGVFTVTVTADDGNGGTPASDDFELTVQNTNSDPFVDTPIPDQAATDDTPFSLDISANFDDADAGDALTFAIFNEPTSGSLTINAGTGEISGTPNDADVAECQPCTITVTADDGNGGTPAQDMFDLTVNDANDDPTVVAPIADQNATDDVAYSLDSSAAFDDVDAGDTLTYGASGLPASGSLAINSSTGEISGTPDDADVAGSPYTVTVTADDGNGGTPASDDFQLTIADANDDPVLDTPIADDIAVEGTAYSYDISGNFSDADAGDTLTYSATGLPGSGNLAINSSTGVISGTPDNDDASASYDVTVTASDSGGGTPASDTFVLTVQNTNSDPFLVTPIADDIAVEGTPYSRDVSGSFDDLDAGDSLAYTATGLPASGNLTIDPATGVISGTPDNDDVAASYDITVTADDGNGGTPAEDTFVLAIQNTNNDPVLATPIDDQGATSGTAFSLDVSGNFDDDDAGDALTYSAGGLPPSGRISINATTGVISGTPNNDDAGTYTVTVMADDGNGGTPAEDVFELIIAAVSGGGSSATGPLGLLVLGGLAFLRRRRNEFRGR